MGPCCRWEKGGARSPESERERARGLAAGLFTGRERGAGPGRKEGKLGFGWFSRGFPLFLLFYFKAIFKTIFLKKITLNYF